MANNLVIVESPAKAKTIEKFLGSDYQVESSYGHIADLPSKEIGVDVLNGFKPKYEVSADKKALVTKLRGLAKTADMVWLASDEDREGEAISWHLAEELKLDKNKTKRIVFHEITKNAILKAIDNPREIEKFLATSFYNVRGSFDLGTAVLKADLNRKLKDSAEANDFLSRANGADFTIDNMETKPAKRTPAAPFTTSTLQQEASRKLGFSVSRTMVIAQRLYESGKITYMRTDSVNLSDLALDAAKQEVTRAYGAQYSKTRQYTNKNKSAQEAHEAIRPTEMGAHQVEGERDEQRLYELIWKRTLASQMADAELEKTTATIGISTMSDVLQAKGEVVKFDGFLKVYTEGTDDEESEDGGSGMLPPLTVGQKLNFMDMTATQRFTQKPTRYSEAALVKRLEELGIGRPSTYAPTISTIQQREYIEKKDKEGTPRVYEVLVLKGGSINKSSSSENTGAEKSKLFPTDIGMVVNDFLVDQFPTILDYAFTANVEQEFDEIAEGNLKWQEMLKKFYKPFHENVANTIENAARQTGERELGTDPKTGKPVIARIARFGPVVQLGASDDEEKKFASLRAGQSIGTINLEEAMKLFDLPRVVGEYQGQTVTAAIGRFGPFVKWGSTYASLRVKEGDDPFSIEIERAVKLIEDKINGINAALIQKFDNRPEIQIIQGRFGPYIKREKDNFKLPKGMDAKTISLPEVLAAIAEQEANPSNKKKAASRKPAATKKAAPKKAAARKAPAKKSAKK
jgi:DNA topoisomerase-1